jgi:hypothetical protein
VTISIVDPDDGTGTVEVRYSSDAGAPRAFALDLAVDGGAAIIDVNSLGSEYYVNPGSVQVDGGGNITGSIVCDNSYPGTKDGLGNAEATTEQGSLYASGDPAPAASGLLFTVTVDADSCLTITENTIRGGVVMEDPDEDPVLTGAGGTLVTECIDVEEPCGGDIAASNSLLGADGKVDLGDIQALLTPMLSSALPNFEITGAAYANADIAASNGLLGADGKIDLGDFQAMLTPALGSALPNFEIPCF